MTVALVTPPAVPPVTLAALKEHLRITEGDEDAYLLDLVAAAASHVEHASGRKLVTQVWRRYGAGLPSTGGLPLGLGPVLRIEAVTLFDIEGTPVQALAGDWRLVDETLFLDRVSPRAAANGVEIDVVCGYGDTPDDVPDTLRRAVLMLAAHWHEFRGAVAPKDQPVSLPPGFDALVRPFRRILL